MKRLFTLFSVVALILFGYFNATGQQITNGNSKTALVIIDIQNFYFPDGALPLYEPEKAADKAKELLVEFRKNDMLVIHIRHNAKSGAEIYHLVAPLANEKVISKDKANAFIGTDLLDYLNENNIINLVLCGMQTHMCLEAATRAASDYGFNCTVINDACTTRDLQFGDVIVKAQDVHYSTLNTLNGTYAKIKTSDEFISSLK